MQIDFFHPMAPKKAQSKITSTLKPVKPRSASKTKEKQQKNWDHEREVLRCFDLDINYGPLVGISRRDRLARAESFSIPVSDEVKRILHDLELPDELDLNIWHDLEGII